MISKLLENIRRVRKEKGISQIDISYDLGIDYSTYGKIERGAIALTVERMEKIAKILKVSVSDIYPSINSPENKNEEFVFEGKFKIIKVE